MSEQTRRFPFPMPFGWFKVALADDIPVGEIVTRHYFDTELVIWRDADGSIACQEAYCPHLGAHLGWGGTVEGKRIRCPFHGWAFDCEGVNVEIPYADRPNRKAHLRSFPVREHAGIVFAWYHPAGDEPKWELIDVPEYTDDAYAPYDVYDYTVKTCIQEMSENGFDHAHFQYVHSRIDIYGRGPGFAVTRYRGLLDASLIGCSTPIDDETTHLTFLFTVKDADDEKTAKIARAFIKSVTSEVQQDIPIWEHKRYQPSPALAPSEKPITEFRRWFSQFYA